ncbi:hypothetical protein BV22DRAFT_1052917 [Leucogyrophana mollusca]|uniref:Uncharacterized protein n=1 Tax=Leucogyrophana mollusca TaxID=85980 RepID=A0ACB8C1L4_9AGAM|nr:hypothetical protein BV22DRAFT_1052917 [Leucogyrophana mollusca]
MSTPLSTELSSAPRTFQGKAGAGGIGSPSPKDFREFLNGLLENDLGEASPAQGPVRDKSTWLAVISGLSEQIIGPFPYATPATRSTSNERLVLADVSLDVLSRVAERVEYLYAGEEATTKKLFVGLLGLCTSAESWLEVEATVKEDAPPPCTLYPKALHVLVGLLRSLGTVRPEDGPEKSSWKFLREVLSCCVETCEGHIIVDLLSKTLYPALLPQWFMVDLMRRITEITRLTFDYCLTCPTSPSMRSRSLARVIDATSTIMIQRNGFGCEGALEGLQCHLLLRRLEEGPKLGCDVADSALKKVLIDAPYGFPAAAAFGLPVLNILRRESWGDAGQNLRLVAKAFVRLCVPHSDPATLQAMKVFFAKSEPPEDEDVLLRQIEQRQADLLIDEPHKTQKRAALTWCTKVREMLQEVIIPDQVDWMDIGDNSSADMLVQKALDGIQKRFIRPLHETSTSARLSIAERLVAFSALISETEGLVSLTPVSNASLFVPLTVLMDGPPNEVTAQVRQRIYSSLNTIIHRSAACDELTDITEFIQRGLVDKERFVRLDAGINRLLETTVKASFKETTLITVGSIGKVSTTEVLGQAVCCLISQLGDSNPIIKGVAYILAHVFQLHGPGQPNISLQFILKVLDNKTIDIQSVIKSCVVPLLAELVVVLGDENDDVAASALQALKKVARTLLFPKGDRDLADIDLTPLLKSYMLGVVSNLNDMLQDVQGKKSIPVKRQILRGLGVLFGQIGSSVHNIAPQIMATLQTMFLIPELAEVTLATWYIFLSTLSISDVGPHIGPTSASIVSSWSTLSPAGRESAKTCLHYIIFEIGERSGAHLDEVVDLSAIPDFANEREKLKTCRRSWSPREKLEKILERSTSDNFTVALQSLGELKAFMLREEPSFIQSLASGDVFDSLIGKIQSTLFAIACRDGEGTDPLRLLAFECMGILGAIDPDRCEIGLDESRMVVRSNFTDEGESVLFALHLIKDVLVGAFRSTSDIKYQAHLAFTIQELLSFCKFTPALVAPGSTSVPMKVRNRWNSLPKHILETVTPLLEAKFAAPQKSLPELQHPIYPHQRTYREWVQLWTAYLITKASGPTAQKIFGVFRSAVRNRDVGVAHHLLPHLVLNILLSGNEVDQQHILAELLAVLEDQVALSSMSTPDKKFLSAQAVFMLLDHLSKYVRILRQEISSKIADSKRARGQQVSVEGEEQLVRVDSVLSSIDHDLMAKAALQCKAYARSLMNFERQIMSLRERQSPSQAKDITPYYERLHEIYANLDEPDGMEGISTLILSPSLEHQIRQHESTGRWTSAQSCWEVRLQQSPDNLDFHLGLLRCLRNLGHYDTLRTHVQGVLVRNPDWESALAGFQAESAWMIGAWDDVHKIVENTAHQSPPIVKARVLLAMRSSDPLNITTSLALARSVLGTPITASGAKGYRRSYDALLDLHLIHEVEMIHASISQLPSSSQDRRLVMQSLGKSLAARLDHTLPNFRIRESVLSMRRTAFLLSIGPRPSVTGEIGRSWLASAKIARKAGQWQTAYSAVLQAQQSNVRFSFLESAKLVKVTGEPLRALQELENSMRLIGLIEDKSDTIDLTEDSTDTKRMKAKSATDLWPKWESGFYHLGQFHDQCFKNLTLQDQEDRGIRMNLHTVRNFAKAIMHGSKYVYQTVPRLLTLWLDMGEHAKISSNPVFAKVNSAVSVAIDSIPVYKWFTAFPQIVSRVGHSNTKVYAVLSKLISMVIQEYPNQALWLFTSVVKSTKANREQRGKAILDQLRNNPAHASTQLPMLITQCVSMTDELLRLCNHPIDDERKAVSMKKDFPRLAALGRSPLLIPLQESLTANLPPASSGSNSAHNPFPPLAPTFEAFFDEIEVMRSLAKPRKITIRGSNGQIYMFLGKPKDDLRKDARLMDFNAIINKLLKANSESRRRQLHIRTYGVVTLNEECGFIQWVPNTIPVRPVLIKGYDARRIRSWSNELSDVFKKIKETDDKKAAQLFVTKVLPVFPPVFHEWFIETFPEPSAWLASRLSYGRTAAVMSMVGFILGLGDRHCENILLDANTGDVVHVDFNCLFEKGKTLETPERVPFRLTQNMVDGLGVTGVEGVFRIACEVTMQLLRDNKDSLMSVLDAFIHDPLVEWEDEKRRMDRDGRRNVVKSTTDLRHLAKNALLPIEKKLKGIYSTSKERHEKEISTSNLVQMLIQEATDDANLAKMYPGWAAWH